MCHSDDAVKEFINDETLKKIAHELTGAIRRNISIDWSVRKSAQAGMRKIIKRLLKKYDYPPDKSTFPHISSACLINVSSAFFALSGG